MHDGYCDTWQGSGGLGRTYGLERLGILWFGLGMWEIAEDGPVRHFLDGDFAVDGLEGVG